MYLQAVVDKSMLGGSILLMIVQRCGNQTIPMNSLPCMMGPRMCYSPFISRDLSNQNVQNPPKNESSHCGLPLQPCSSLIFQKKIKSYFHPHSTMICFPFFNTINLLSILHSTVIYFPFFNNINLFSMLHRISPHICSRVHQGSSPMCAFESHAKIK